MEDRSCKLDVTKVTGAFLGAFFASLAVVLAVDCSEAWVVNTFRTRALTLVILCF